MDGSLPQVSWGAMLPFLLITGTGLLVLVLDPLMSPERRDRLPVLSLGGVVCAALALLWRRDQPEIVFGGMLAADGFALFFNLLFLLVAGLTLLISIAYIRRTGLEHGEYSALLLFSTLGMMIMASSLDLMTIFLGLETLSISLYILAGFLRDQIRSNESALKYLLLGAFASGFVLYGIALVYGATGSINLTRVARALALGQVHDPILLTIGMGLLIVGFGFKVAAVPFHMWAPDVYEGAPTSVTAFMIAGTKAAAFAAFLRILMTALPALQPDWSRVLWVLAVADHDRRQRGGHRPDQHQADAGLQLHRPRRVRPGGPGDRDQAGERRHPLLPAGLHLHEPGRLRRRGGRGAARGRAVDHRRLCRAGPHPPRPGGGDGPVHVLAGGRAPHGGVHGEALRLQCGHPGELPRVGDHRRGEQRDLGVLLPPDHGGDVHGPRAGRAALRTACRRPWWRPS